MYAIWEQKHNQSLNERQRGLHAQLSAVETKNSAPERAINVNDPWGFGGTIIHRFPALKQRNFFVIQQHHAAADHFDLRLQCSKAHPSNRDCLVCGGIRHESDGSSRVPGTLSFAIPMGLSGMTPSSRRIAIETNLHSIDYSIFEGGGIGTTQLYDVGTYYVQSTHSSKSDKAADTTDEDVSESEPGLYGGHLGMNQEEALARAYEGNSDTSSFTVELRGQRYRIRITMSHQKESQAKVVRQKWTGRQTIRKRWFLQLAAPLKPGQERLNHEDLALGDRSILSGDTMDEIRERYRESSSSHQGMRQPSQEDITFEGLEAP